MTRELVIGAEASGVSGGGGGTGGVDLLEGVDALSLLVEEHLKMHGLALGEKIKVTLKHHNITINTPMDALKISQMLQYYCLWVSK